MRFHLLTMKKGPDMRLCLKIKTACMVLALVVLSLPAIAFANEADASSGSLLFAQSVEYGEWGSWSNWSWSVVSPSDTRQVETRSVAQSYHVRSDTCGDSSGTRCYLKRWSNGCGYSLRASLDLDIAADTLNASQQCAQGSFYTFASNVNGLIVGPGTAYVGAWSDWRPVFITSTTYGTQYRYRTRSATAAPSSGGANASGSFSERNAAFISGSLEISSCVIYKGKKVNPTIKLIVGGAELVRGVDYTLKCNNSNKIGKVTVTITGLGFYAGCKRTCTFKIIPKSTSIKSAKSKKSGSKVVVRWKKAKKAYCTGYEIRYSTHKNMSSCKTKRVGGCKKRSAVIGGLKPGKTYYIRICVFKKVHNTVYRSAWSAARSVRTKSKSAKRSVKIWGGSGFRVFQTPGTDFHGKKLKLSSTTIKGNRLIVKGAVGEEAPQGEGVVLLKRKPKTNIFILSKSTKYYLEGTHYEYDDDGERYWSYPTCVSKASFKSAISAKRPVSIRICMSKSRVTEVYANYGDPDAYAL